MSPRDGEISLSRNQIREIDRRAIEQYGIPGIVLMENAGRNAAGIIRGILEEKLSRAAGASEDSRTGNGANDDYAGGAGFVAIVCGRGNNGGDGFVIARHLANVNVPVELFLAFDPTALTGDRPRSAGLLTGDAATNFGIVEKMELTRHPFDSEASIADNKPRLAEAAVIVDAVLGTGFAGEVRSPLDLVIAAINEARAESFSCSVVATDVPSGLDCDTGKPSNATIRADVTITFVARKIGFDAPGAAGYTGRVVVTYIGAPTRLIDEFRS